MPVFKIKLNGEWVDIYGGSGGDIDLSNYATKDEISEFQTAEQVQSLIDEALGVIENGSY